MIIGDPSRRSAHELRSRRRAEESTFLSVRPFASAACANPASSIVGPSTPRIAARSSPLPDVDSHGSRSVRPFTPGDITLAGPARA